MCSCGSLFESICFSNECPVSGSLSVQSVLNILNFRDHLVTIFFINKSIWLEVWPFSAQLIVKHPSALALNSFRPYLYIHLFQTNQVPRIPNTQA